MKTFTRIVIFAALALSISSCKNGDETAVDPAITITNSDFTVFDAAGSEAMATFKINVDWTATVTYQDGSGWLEATTGGKASESAAITMKAKTANDTYSDRKAFVTINYGGNKTHRLTVTQKQNDALKLDGDKEIEVGPEAKDLTITLQKNVTYTTTISDNAKSWITAKSTKALSTDNLVFGVAANDTYEERTGTITFKAGSIEHVVTITQKQKDALQLDSDASIEVAAAGIELNVKVKQNVTYTITISDNAKSWLSEKPKSRALTTDNLVFVANANDTYSERSGTITFKSGSLTQIVTVTQKQNDGMELKSNAQMFADGTGSNLTVVLSTNIATMEIIIPEAATSWLSYPQTKALVDKNMVLKVEKNTENKPRFTTVTFKSTDGALSYNVFIGQVAAGETAENCYYIEPGKIYGVVPSVTTDLKLFGNPNEGDFRYMRDGMPYLANLDLRGTIITAIPNNAFYKISSGKTTLKSIKLPETLKTIGYLAFSGCSGLTGNLTIPNSVTSIGDFAFSGCSGFTGSLTIPNSVTSIGNSAFMDCSGFTGNLIIPNSVTLIENSAFMRCSGFTGNLIIPNSVTSIGSSAFAKCSGFTGSLTIPNSVTSIGNSAFFECSGFTGSLTIPNSITSIGNTVFTGCNGFTGSLTIPNSVISIGVQAFMGCWGFTGDLTIGNRVTTIGNYAFSSCRGIVGSLTIGNSVTSIGGSAFNGCSFTGSLTIGNSVTSIGEFAFSSCKGLTSVIIPNSVTTLGNNVFVNCSNLTSFILEPGNANYVVESGILYDKTMATLIAYPAGIQGNLTIPNSVATIASGAFSGCSGLTGSLTIPSGVTTIESGAFVDCSGFTGSLTIPGGVTTIEALAFAGCSGFTGNLAIPNNVATIGNAAFANCSGFTGSLTIPSSVTSIGSQVFLNCSFITYNCLALTPPTLGKDAFMNTSPSKKLYVPWGSLAAYQNSTDPNGGWKGAFGTSIFQIP